MLLDILIFVPVLICILFGVRDGIVRKIVAIVVLITGLFMAQLYMHDVGKYLVEHAKASQENAPTYGFLLIFIGLFLLQGISYRIITKNYKIGGVADRIGGIVLGFIEGVIFVSSLLFVFAMSGFPDRNNKRDSQFYKSVVNIAPQILDISSLIESESNEKLQEAGKARTSRGYGQGSNPKSIDSTAVIEARKQNENLSKTREALRKNNQ